ncbi:exopolyphosphatase [Fructobacillus evanidus]|uniref:Exopolyphosphatase/pppGpp-phosphohydrolase (GppA) n=1 Tax=Fructobacillus evanidus TaxID=3064281 RepID=A0ABM9MSJ6_9LACO|nr:Exopolyphosphatase/pppGpp-phosphohydrolase (GppA) [Fructobacillus sp. LMG 32999]CAK1234221.1 Exopolyphosphatase/pppGpp-phosphohydrolase (GppA) [Fructobacillus sp. LMG 32999]CAK1236357.1 Exopolyphosphatase/pppGpp-phosphohydrolase (GppA) [Fructobacillus sp. LMG 32999]CAK1236805.1 Exopolyphosphatase/pppGpp-phosphohydrolase (GppA) [Fructobacillus sp. LMG 32999]CAK1236952.1 Exopolyphosphatase/pppGpp-phosphohydrolase (GppA) [Fructobacillus sp. LMG 32999]
MQDRKIAIIDLGSNSTRLVIEELHTNETYTEILRVKEDTRLSQNMGRNLILQEEPMARTIKVLQKYRQKIEDYEVSEVYAITTAAVRSAKNQAEFLERVKDEAEISFRVLTGQEEAHYDFLGVREALPDVLNGVILDTGGASVELIPFKNGQALAEVSVPFGAVNLSERYHLADVIDEADIQQANADIQVAYRKLHFIDDCQNLPVILLGGANRSLAKMAEEKELVYHPKALHGFMMPANQVGKIFHQIAQMSRTEREHLAGLEKNRADIIISGLLPVLNLISVLNAPQVIFSESGVREGLIESLFEEKEQIND